MSSVETNAQSPMLKLFWHPYYVNCLFCLFFFQAEDGIRDRTVTGVQTCALPIFGSLVWHQGRAAIKSGEGVFPICIIECPLAVFVRAEFPNGYDVGRDSVDPKFRLLRSEERRVGKECRFRVWSYHEKNKHKTVYV